MGILDNNYIMDIRTGKASKDIIKKTDITVDEVISYAIENGFLNSERVCISFTHNFKDVKTGSSFELDVTTGIKFDNYKCGYLLQINKGLSDGKSVRPVSNFDYYITSDDIISLSLHGESILDNDFGYRNALQIKSKDIWIWF